MSSFVPSCQPFWATKSIPLRGWNTGNSRNGSYHRTLTTQYGDLDIEIPRDRKGKFHSPLLPKNRQHVDALETTVIQLYRKGVTTRQIADLIEQMYGALLFACHSVEDHHGCL